MDEWNKWSSWNTWNAGSQTRTRSSEGPFAGGTECSGDAMESQSCTIVECSSKQNIWCSRKTAGDSDTISDIESTDGMDSVAYSESVVCTEIDFLDSDMESCSADDKDDMDIEIRHNTCIFGSESFLEKSP